MAMDNGWVHPSAKTLFFSSQQLVMKYCLGWLKFGWKITLSLPKTFTRNENNVGLNLVLVTLYHNLQLVLSKTIKIGDTIPQFTISIKQDN